MLHQYLLGPASGSRSCPSKRLLMRARSYDLTDAIVLFEHCAAGLLRVWDERVRQDPPHVAQIESGLGDVDVELCLVAVVPGGDRECGLGCPDVVHSARGDLAEEIELFLPS